MLIRRPSCMVPALLVAAALSGCAGNGPQLPTMSVTSSPETPPAASVASASVAAAPGAVPPGPDEPRGTPIPGATGSATEIYSHIARGANACWFGANGPLKKDYIFHAAADAPSRGGKAEVTIHERDPTQPNPRGAKAYVIQIQPNREASARVTVENRKMSDAYATAISDDISRWVKGGEGCSQSSTVAGWVPGPPKDNSETPKTSKKPAKAKVKAAQAKPTQQPQSQP